jgi:hypothetical protein
MNDLAVMTPPFLVGAAVIFAIVAFLRHEMGRKRADRPDEQDDIPASARQPDDKQDSKPAEDSAATTSVGDA